MSRNHFLAVALLLPALLPLVAPAQLPMDEKARKAELERRTAVLFRGLQAVGEGQSRIMEDCARTSGNVPYPYLSSDYSKPAVEQTRQAVITISGWTGGCRDGKRDGQGILDWRVHRETEPGQSTTAIWREEGRFVAGRKVGQWCLINYQYLVNRKPSPIADGMQGNCLLSSGKFDLKAQVYRKLPDGRWQLWAGTAAASPAVVLPPQEMTARQEKIVADAMAGVVDIQIPPPAAILVQSAPAAPASAAVSGQQTPALAPVSAAALHTNIVDTEAWATQREYQVCKAAVIRACFKPAKCQWPYQKGPCSEVTCNFNEIQLAPGQTENFWIQENSTGFFTAGDITDSEWMTYFRSISLQGAMKDELTTCSKQYEARGFIRLIGSAAEKAALGPNIGTKPGVSAAPKPAAIAQADAAKASKAEKSSAKPTPARPSAGGSFSGAAEKKGRFNVPEAIANHCLKPSPQSLTGVENTCPFAVEYFYCVYSPTKESYSESFDCQRTKGGLWQVGPNGNSIMHRAGEKVFFFACRYGESLGKPDGISPKDVRFVDAKVGLEGRCGEWGT